MSTTIPIPIAASVRRVSAPSPSFEHLLNVGRYSDITFVIGAQHVKFFAHRVILDAKVPVFRAQLSNDAFVESQLKEIVMEDVSPDAFRLFLEHIYAGDMRKIPLWSAPLVAPPKPLEIIAETFYLADMYDQEELKERCVDMWLSLLSSALNTTGRTTSAEAKLLVQAIKVAHQHLPLTQSILEATLDFAAAKVDVVMRDDEFLAFDEDLVLDIIRRDDIEISEQALFEAVLKWCQVHAAQTLEMMSTRLTSTSSDAGSECVYEYGGGSGSFDEDVRSTSPTFSTCSWSTSSSHSRTHVTVAQLMTNFHHSIRYGTMPATYIRDNIEPLAIVPQEIVATAYLEAAHRESQFESRAQRIRVWDPHLAAAMGMTISNDGRTINANGMTPHRTARTELSLSKFRSSILKWRLHIDESCLYAWIGITTQSTDPMSWMGKEATGWCYGSNGVRCHATGINDGPYNDYYGVPFGRSDLVEVQVDVERGTLAFSVNDVAQGVMFSSIPLKDNEDAFLSVSIYGSAQVTIESFERQPHPQSAESVFPV